MRRRPIEREIRRNIFMGFLVEGEWHEDWYETESTGGRYVRKDSVFRDWIRADGSTAYKPEAGRYHLYVSLACPWAHRTLIVRKLKRLQDAISLSIVDPYMGQDGWTFSEAAGAIPDNVNGAHSLREIYLLADPKYTGCVTVPVLWDRMTRTIVNNESAQIIRMLNAEFPALADASIDLCPEDLREEIDSLNAYVYANINNGVYRCGFATTQTAYEEAFRDLFDALDTVDERLASRRYLLGNRLTEADIRLFTTLVRFDAVYVGHFKCNLRRIADYPNLSGYLRDLYQVPGVSETVNFEHIKRHYYQSHSSINPTRVVPLGPALDLSTPHGREEIT
jgi:putative glutathione S-transferase